MDAPGRGKQTSCGPAGCPVTSPPARSNHFTAPLHCTKLQLAPRCSSSGFHPTVHFRYLPTSPSVEQSTNGPPSLPFFLSFISQVFFPPSPVSDSNRPRSRQPEAALFLRERSGVGAGGADLTSGSVDVSSGISGTTEVWPVSVLVPAVGTPLALLQVGHPHHLPNDRMGCRLSALPRRLKHISILLLSAVHEHAQRRPELGAYGEGGNMVIRRGQSFH